ncbi:MAG: VCBS repeat-containing protein [Verrucomicrobia bacterium]|nr:VCBS repeat-containing protein [Verrucomicrobiota bacterium]
MKTPSQPIDAQRRLPRRWACALALVLSGPLLAASLDPIPDLILDEDAPPREIALRLDPSPLPATAYRFEVLSSDARGLLPPGSLSVVGRAPNPVLQVVPAPDAFGEARITVRALAEGVDPISQSFRLQVLPVNDPPRILPIPNQVLMEGMPTVRLRIEASDPDGNIQLTSTTSDNGRNLRVAMVGNGASRLLDLTPLARNLTSPVRVPVALTAVSGADRVSLTFFVVIQPREFSTVGSAFGGQVPSTATPLPAQTSARFTWSDVNGDGYPDLSSHGLSGVRWTSSQGGGGDLSLTPFGRSGVVNPVGLNALVWGDVNGNGDLEAFAAGRGVFGTYRLQRSGFRSPLILLTNALAHMSVEGSAWADLDGNGSLDLVYTGVTNEVRRVVLALNDGLGNLTMVPHTLPSVAGPVVAADFDQDGRNDLLLCSNTQSSSLARLYLNRGRMVFTEGPVVTGAGGSDVDGDGIADLWPPVTGAGTTDVDGDGVPDLWLVQAVSGNRRALELHVFRQRAGRFTRSFHLNTNEFLAAAEPAWGDLDHDGRVDFVAPYRERVLLANGRESSTNHFAVYHNQGDGRFERGDYLFSVPLPAPSLLPAFVPAVADVDQDGDLDILGHETGYRAFYNLRREPNVPPDAPSGLRALVVGDEVFLFWSPAFDANQTTPLSYNVRVGTSPGTNDVVASQSLANGTRQVSSPGNAGFLQSFSFRLPREDLSRVFWSVQAVDASFSGGPFAPEQSLDVAQPGNQPPRIEAPAEVTLSEDSMRVVEVVVADDRTPPQVLALQVDVSPVELIGVTWSPRPDPLGAATRRVVLTALPDRTGVAVVTLRVTDRNGAETTHEIRVTVVPENDRPVLTAEIPRFGLRGRPIRGTIHLQDAESLPEALSLSALSSNPGLLPDAGIALAGNGANREFVATPDGGAVGDTTVTLTVTDTDGLSTVVEIPLRWQEQLFDAAPVAEAIPQMSQILAADVDGDGLLDLAGADAAVPGVVAVWRQAPVGTWSESGRIVTGLIPGSLVPGDFDGDGDLDLVVSAAVGSLGSGGVTAILLWNDDGRLEKSTPLLLNETYLKWVAMDADGDGDLDLVAGTQGTSLQFWRHPGGIPGADAARHWGPFPLERPTALIQGLQTDSFLEALLPVDEDEDGRMDLLVSRSGEPAVVRGLTLRQNANGLFAVNRPRWSGVAVSLGAADFDNDGRTDFLLRYPLDAGPIARVILGRSESRDVGVLENDGVLGDLDGDGFEDLLLSASEARGVGTLSDVASVPPRFTPQPVQFWSRGPLIPADLNADGRLDLLGLQSLQPLLIQNLGAPSNAPPEAPGGLQIHRLASDEVELVWTAATDAEQAGGLSYNVRVGTGPGAGDVVSAMATPKGRALLPGRGNAGWRTRFRLRGLEVGRPYYWTVQAVDAGFARSAFAAEATLKLTALPEISAIADVSLPISAGEQTIAFHVSDPDTPASALQVAVISSNPVLLPASRLSLSGEGEARSLQLHPKPDRAGTAEITVRVTDGEQLSAERRFTVFVPSPSGYAATTNWSVVLAAGDSVELALDGFDPEGDFLEYQVGTPLHGTISGAGPSITYHAAAGYAGADRVEYVATTPGSWPARGVITIQIEPAYRLRPEVRLASFGLPPRWQLVFRGRAGSRVVLEQSRDLRTWEPLGEHEFPSNEALSVPPPDLAEDAVRFFRLMNLSR